MINWIKRFFQRLFGKKQELLEIPAPYKIEAPTLTDVAPPVVVPVVKEEPVKEDKPVVNRGPWPFPKSASNSQEWNWPKAGDYGLKTTPVPVPAQKTNLRPSVVFQDCAVDNTTSASVIFLAAMTATSVTSAPTETNSQKETLNDSASCTSDNTATPSDTSCISTNDSSNTSSYNNDSSSYSNNSYSSDSSSYSSSDSSSSYSSSD